MKVTRTRAQKASFVLGIIFLVAAFFAGLKAFEKYMAFRPEGAGEAYYTTVDENKKDDNYSPEVQLQYDGKNYIYNPNLSTLLIIGIDDSEVTEYEGMINQSQADMLMVAIFNHGSKTYDLIQINRDTMTDIKVYDSFGKYEGISPAQIALSHTYRPNPSDACDDTLYAVSRLLYDVKIDNYFALTMNAIPVVNDAVGGVTVHITDDFTGIDSSLKKDTDVLLMGDKAETFVRSRMSMKDDPTNINRMARQKVYMTSFLSILGEKVNSDVAFANSFYETVEPYMVTDCATDRLNNYISEFNGYKLGTIYEISGKSVEGTKFMEFYPDDDALKKMIIDIFYTEI